MRSIFVSNFICVIIFIPQERYSSYESGIGKKITDGQTSFEELEVYFFLNNLPIYDNRISIKELAEPQYVKIFCKIKILVHVHLLFIIGLLDQPDSDFENILYKFFQKTFFQKYILDNGSPTNVASGRQEHYESMLNHYV